MMYFIESKIIKYVGDFTVPYKFGIRIYNQYKLNIVIIYNSHSYALSLKYFCWKHKAHSSVLDFFGEVLIVFEI